VRHAIEWQLPFVEELLGARNAAEDQRSKTFVRENLNAMAVKLGQMQAQLMRLDLLGERLAHMSGMKLPEREPEDKAGGAVNPLMRDARGGPLLRAMPLSQGELLDALDGLSHQVERRSDTLALIESQLLDRRARDSMLPSSLPVESAWSSNFGWRIDPFTGDKALHEGVDFPAAPGTPVSVAADGMVVTAEHHPEYGNMIEIEHGNGLTTRYAHLARMQVQTGVLVRRGQTIGLVGNTGRSTGSHLHFEVRLHGAAQNPARFLQQASTGGARLSLARRK
jgi:murein DD-endopeptidase MepM/ murein hydrolase activator NlpD